MLYLRQCGYGKAGFKRMKRKAVDPPSEPSAPPAAEPSSVVAPAAPTAPDSDEDIFEGVGKDYVCEKASKPASQPSGEPTPAAAYFNRVTEPAAPEAGPRIDDNQVQAAIPEEVKQTLKLQVRNGVWAGQAMWGRPPRSERRGRSG